MPSAYLKIGISLCAWWRASGADDLCSFPGSFVYRGNFSCIDTNSSRRLQLEITEQECAETCCATHKCQSYSFSPLHPSSCWVYTKCDAWTRNINYERVGCLLGTTCFPPAPQPPPPPPSPAPPAPKGWPTFMNQSALAADPWGKYYLSVYGEWPGASGNSYPMSPGNNWCLYDKGLVSAQITQIPSSSGNCPTASPPEGQRYNTNSIYAPSFTSWIWHPYPYKALPANTWQEINHEADPFGDEHFGAWFVYAPGSGIYFNVGNTMSFKEHSDAYRYFSVVGGNYNEELSKKAALSGYDSLQFLAHVDHVSYPCDTQNTGKTGLDYMGIEFVASKLVGTFACGTSAGAPSVIRAGWQASTACKCDNSLRNMNCAVVSTYSDSSVEV